MPLTPNFSASQSIGQPSIITLTDTSTGSDVTITERRVFLVNSAGEYVVPTGTTTPYVVWPIADISISINCLDFDSALNITVNWVNSGGTTVVTKTSLEGFTLYNESFYYSLTQAQASQSSPPPIIQDTNYYQSKMQLRVLIDSGNNAITLGADISSAQSCYNMASALVANQNDFF